MKNIFKKRVLTEEYLIEELKDAILAEKIAGDFYRYIAKKIKNGRIKNRFKHFADEEAKTHKELLQKRLKEIIGITYNPNPSELGSSSELEGFSLIGALDIAKKSEERAMKFYKKAKARDASEYKKMYKDLVKEEENHWRYIGREKKFIQSKEFYTDLDGIRLCSFLARIYK